MLNAVKLWLLISSLLVSAGWVLSAFHQLNRIGYSVVFALGAAGLFFWLWKNPGQKSVAQVMEKGRRRFRRLAPLLFLALAILSFIGGALYVSQNNDSDEYRIPRVWHWLAEGRWHWIYTLDFRMNAAGCNFEWLVAPLMLFTRHDRFLFLMNLASFLLMPGLIFSVFTRLQVRPRVAWWWMWLLPSGWCYAMQASSDCNDSFAVVYALASVDFALRAREKNRISDLWFSILAVALLTGAKQTNFPLVLPWLLAVIPALRLLKSHLPATLGVGVLALLSSALPLAYLNFQHAGNWMGFPAVPGLWRLTPPPPVWCFVGNIFCLPLQNLLPPYFPFVARWDELMQHFLQTPFGSHFQSFEFFGHLNQGASEGDVGIGLFIFLLALASIVAAMFYRPTVRPVQNFQLVLLRWVPFLSLFIFMAKVATYENARQMAAYYPLLFPAFLTGAGQAILVNRKWWQMAGLTAMVLTAGLLVVSRGRPLFPAESILLPLKEKYPHWHFLSKTWDSYACRLSVETQRSVFNDALPADEHVIGYATVRGSQEPGKWLPFGRRRVERVLPDDQPSELQAKGIHFVFIDSTGLADLDMTIGDWTNRFDGVLVGTTNIEGIPGTIATDYLVRLNPPGTNDLPKSQ